MSYLILIAGLGCAAIGGELFVRGIVGLARWARISAGIIGATFAAFATSSPELSVAVTSALAQKPQIALGDALGSNVVNLALILGLALAIAPMTAPGETLRRDYSVALLVPVLLAVLAYDGVLDRVDGVILISVFVGWLTAVVLEVRRQRNAAKVPGESGHFRIIAVSLAGFVLLVISGRLIVSGATDIALAHGIDPFIIGATLVAIGTSAPELATAIVSKLRGHDEVGLGTLLGSNIFNGLFIIAVASILHPIALHREVVAIGLIFGLIATIACFPTGNGKLGRERGWMLLAIYAGYLGVVT